ncbi:MAG: hypothetical protein U5K79_17395 [Cyclobacteriaceae bacterium]|nr:hypothetical protein [Cyclobacteriaceae bacterium]
MRLALFLLCAAMGFVANAQLPVEVFGGNKKTTVDIMFFKFFRNGQGENTRWLFFNRNRASIDYQMTETINLPQFGFTEAISYNHPALKGVAPVVIGQIFNRGVFPKAGVQFAHIKKDFTIFTWLVCETLEMPDLDYFLLLRFTPGLSEKLDLFAQAESVNVMPTAGSGNYSFTQRLRLGFQKNGYQFGAGADFNQTGNGLYSGTQNVGGFIRHEF